MDGVLAIIKDTKRTHHAVQAQGVKYATKRVGGFWQVTRERWGSGKLVSVQPVSYEESEQAAEQLARFLTEEESR